MIYLVSLIVHLLAPIYVDLVLLIKFVLEGSRERLHSVQILTADAEAVNTGQQIHNLTKPGKKQRSFFDVVGLLRCKHLFTTTRL
jgi:hypothetical protein